MSDKVTLAEMSQWTAVLGTAAQWAAVVATTAAIVVALFKEELIRRLRHPTLTAKLEAKHPFIVQTPNIEGDYHGSRYFIRLWIKNTGNVRADKVEIFLSEALVLQNNSYQPLPNFTAMNLRWSYGDYSRPDIYIDGISPNMGRLCDFGAISDPEHPTLRYLSETTTRLSLRQEALSDHMEWLRPGNYRFKLLVAGSNCEPKAYWIDLDLKGRWDNDPGEMMAKGFVLSIREE